MLPISAPIPNAINAHGITVVANPAPSNSGEM